MYALEMRENDVSVELVTMFVAGMRDDCVSDPVPVFPLKRASAARTLQRDHHDPSSASS